MARILLIDDDAGSLKALSLVLDGRIPAEIATCNSAISSLKRIDTTEFDAVISDIKMPGMDGLTLLKEIHIRSQNTPVILTTAYEEPEYSVQALRAGAFDFIRKPFDVEYLVASATRALLHAQSTRDVESKRKAVEQRAAELEREVELRAAALVANHARLEMALHAGNMGTWDWDIATGKVSWSTSLEQMHGLPVGSFAGNFDAFQADMHPEDRVRVLETISKSVSEGIDHHIQYRFVRTDGAIRWVEAHGKLFKDPSGVPLRMAGICADITERKEAELEAAQLAQRLNFMAESMPQKIFTATSTGEVDYFNKQWTEFTGLTFDEIKNWGWTQFIHPDDVEGNVRRWKQSIDTGEPFQFEHRFRRHDGAFRWHLSRARALRGSDGHIIMWIGSNTDIDDQKRDQLALREAKEQAERANQAKDQFFATLSHELRSPLTPMLGWCRMLLNERLDEQTRKGLTVIERNAKMQSKLIEDILDVSRIITGKLLLNVVDVDANRIIEAAIEVIRPVAITKAIQIERTFRQEPVVIAGDPDRLEQVVWNLLTNAVKFTPKSGKILIGVESKKTNVEIFVKDSGIGIRPDFLPHVFDRFSQADSTSIRDHGGLGIGLSLVKHLTELHGGSVRVESEGEGKGATFTVSLPVQGGNHVDTPTDKSERHDMRDGILNNVKLLVVDDDADARELFTHSFHRYGAQAITVTSVREALENYRKEKPDLIISDLGMPVEDGFALIKEIRTLEANSGKYTPAIALTAFAGDEDRVRCLAAGFQIHIPKPIDPTELVRTVSKILRRI